ncbi:MAG: VWA domain-containing protein [Spirochaetales bacterium]|nr:VWA domain-containing protein [Spirochaetales bacterium]
MKRFIILLCLSVIIPFSLVSQEKPEVELVFVLDTTGSMSSLIQAAKMKIWSIINSMATAKPAPDIKVGLVGYRDKSDSYITQIVPLSEDIDAVYSELMNFTANGGGDTPESVNQALNEGVSKIAWSESKSVYKVIFLVGDAPPHMDYPDDVKYGNTCKLAVTKNININSIQCGNISGTESIWREIAKLGKGEYFRVSQSGDATYYTTPFDDEMAEKSRELDRTRIYYGSYEFKTANEERLSKAKDIYSDTPSSVIAQRLEFNKSESGKKNFLGTQELVDDVISGNVKLEELKKEELPEELKKKTTDEIRKYIETKNAERKKLISVIDDLSKKRQDYIKKLAEENKKKDSLDSQIFKVLSTQAKDKGIIFSGELLY